MKIFLTDNGSLQPESTLSLRTLAKVLTARVGIEVLPVSLLHSDRVDPADLEGHPARVFQQEVSRLLDEGERDIRILPLFIGPSRALTDYIPRKVVEFTDIFPDLEISVGDPLVRRGHPGDLEQVGQLLAQGVRETQSSRPDKIVLVDHGTPIQPVNEVRNLLARWLENTLDQPVIAASMERRPEAAYAFNEPLLEHVLGEIAPCAQIEITLSMLFLQPGKHAGPGGDIDQIVAQALRDKPKVHLRKTRLLAEFAGLNEILNDRLDDLLEPAKR